MLISEWCTHASVVDGHLTSFVACPSNDMLMTYHNGTYETIGRRAEQWTLDFLDRLKRDPTPSKRERRLTGHFAFDFIVSTKDGQLYPLECNARVHTAIILLPLSKIADCYSTEPGKTLRPDPDAAPRSWIYNDLVMRYLPRILPSSLLGLIHPSLPACLARGARPNEDALRWRVDPSLVADDWVPFLILWHVYWPSLLLRRWWNGQRWTRVSYEQFLADIRSTSVPVESSRLRRTYARVSSIVYGHCVGFKQTCSSLSSAFSVAICSSDNSKS
jgi:hypothetical protein